MDKTEFFFLIAFLALVACLAFGSAYFSAELVELQTLQATR